MRYLTTVLSAAIAGLFPLAASTGQIDSATFFSLRRGMSESEILVRAGAPDLVTLPGGRSVELSSATVVELADGTLRFDGFARTADAAIERWHYVPAQHERDPFITIVSIRGGRVWELERTKVFTRARAEPSSLAVRGSQAGMSDDEIMAARLDRTVEAARLYAETRARLLQELASGPSVSTTVYRQVQPDGSVYFGDRPPAETQYTDVE